MSSLLLISDNPVTTDEVSAVVLPAGYRMRTVSSGESARELLSMYSYDVLLVDAKLRFGEPTDYPKLLWKLNPMAIVGVISLLGPIDTPWDYLAHGIKVFSDEAALKSIKVFIDSLPATLPNQEDYGVLLVEDLDSPREIIQSYIETLGYPRVTGAASADAALAVLRTQLNAHFVVITDINMPQKNGVILLKEIRADAQLMHLPVIMLTAHSSADNLIECLREGASGFLVKPPKKKSLAAELDKARRIFFLKQPARLCRPEDATMIEAALQRTAFRLG